ncbi:MAG: glycosyltransferase family 4 protein [Gammaproteobacteria bacterium]|nr:glycosyltransferase family 4 protein [Gammaproteobacteria bacterium]
MATLLSINNYYYPRGGAETVFLAHNRLLEDGGWTVVPFAMRHPDNLDTPWSEYFVEEIEYGSSYSLLDKLRRVPKVIYSQESRANIDSLLKVSHADICHAHNIYHHISPSIFSAVKKHDIPVVMTLHDLKLSCPAYNMLSHDGICERCKGGREFNVLLHRCIKGSFSLSMVVFMEAMLHKVLATYSKYVDKFIVPSRFYLDKMVEWGWPREKFVYIPNFIQASSYAPESGLSGAFAYFGRLSREKGLVTLIRAVAQAGVSLNIAGTGPDEDHLKRLARDLSADVRFHGYIKGKALHDFVRSSRCVVLPSEWYENSPMSVLEAYALGRPVLGAAIGGIPELIRPDSTGLVFDSGSVESLANALRSMADSPDHRLIEMGRAGRAWVESDFSSDNYKGKILELYSSLGVRC